MDKFIVQPEARMFSIGVLNMRLALKLLIVSDLFKNGNSQHLTWMLFKMNFSVVTK